MIKRHYFVSTQQELRDGARTVIRHSFTVARRSVFAHPEKVFNWVQLGLVDRYSSKDKPITIVAFNQI